MEQLDILLEDDTTKNNPHFITIIFVYGFQLVLSVLPNLLYIPLRIFPLLCLLPDDDFRADIFSSVLFTSGLATILQTMKGIKHPVVMVPSFVLFSSTMAYSKEGPWETLTDGTLYAYGPEGRHTEYLRRTGDICGSIIFLGIAHFLIYSLGRYITVFKIPSVTITSVLICVGLSSALQVFPHRNSDTNMTTVVFVLFFFLWSIRNLVIPLPVILGGFKWAPLNIFNIFPIIIIILLYLLWFSTFEKYPASLYPDLDESLTYSNLMRRAVDHITWYSPNYPSIFKGFNFPTLSLESVYFLFPGFLSQFLTSYVCYSLLAQKKETVQASLLIETLTNLFTACLGLPFYLSVEHCSLGFLQMSQIGYKDTSIVAGVVMILFSFFVKTVFLLSKLSLSVSFGISLFLYGLLVSKGLHGSLRNSVNSSTAIGLSVMAGLVAPSLMKNIRAEDMGIILNIYHFLINPALIAFNISLILYYIDKIPYLKNNQS